MNQEFLQQKIPEIEIVGDTEICNGVAKMNRNFNEFREAVLTGKLQTLQGMYNLENVINSRGIFPRGIGGRWTTALIFSVQQNMVDIFKFLLTVPGIDVNLVDPNCERTALHWAAFNNNHQMVQLLLKMPNIKVQNISLVFYTRSDFY